MRLSITAAATYAGTPFDLLDRFPVVAYIDERGYLRCPECASIYEGHSGTQSAQYADNAAMERATCDTCHAPIDEIISAARVVTVDALTAQETTH